MPTANGDNMNEEQIQRIESSFNLLAPRAPELADRFYATLFARHPEVRGLFPDDMSDQKKKLVASLVLVVKNIRKPEALRNPLLSLGQRHAEYGCVEAQYPVVRDTLIEVMSQMAGEAWNQQLQDDWTTAIDFVSEVMIEGQQQAATLNA